MGFPPCSTGFLAKLLRKEKTEHDFHRVLVPSVLTQGRQRAALTFKPAHICTHGRSRHSADACSTWTHTTGSHAVTEQSHRTSQARIGEEGEGPDHQPVSVEERKKQDRFEAEYIENRRENKVEGRAQPA